MDAKNDDSGGSDSLDKSLQKKCVVDVGQGEGASTSKGDCEKRSLTDQMLFDPTLENSVKKQKTEKDARDSSESGVLDTGWVNSGVASGHHVGASRDVTSNDEFAKERTAQDDKYIKDNINVASSSHNISDAIFLPSTSNAISTVSGINNKAFETKVKQISKDLKETTLTETADKTKTSQEDLMSSSSNSSEGEQTIGASSSMPADSSQISEMDSSMLSANDSVDDQDNRSKKVRFHPDVKENDGGNRIIPKKKKKLKPTGSGDDVAGSRGMVNNFSNTEEEMDLDEEEPDDDDEFDLAKTIAEAENYL